MIFFKKTYFVFVLYFIVAGQVGAENAGKSQYKNIHIVKKGETLNIIAKKYGIRLQELIEFNKILNPDKIFVGKKIKLLDIKIKTVDAKSIEPFSGIQAELDPNNADERWRVIQKTIFPKQLIPLCDGFVRDFKNSAYAPDAVLISKSAKMALHGQLVSELTDETLRSLAKQMITLNDLVKALRGDKEAAYRVAQMYRVGSNGLSINARRTEQWLRFSAELGHGLGSWELAEIYLASGQQADAAKFEKLAVELGYVPRPVLSNRGY